MLTSLVRDDSSIDAIAEYLDALAPDAREREVNALGRGDQARLFEKASVEVRLTDFVPRAVSDLSTVIHPGRNTIATLTYFQRFEKRFARPASDRARLFGYNVSNAFFIHPGYFVAYETSGEWSERGGVVIDYHAVPDAAVPEGWPAIVPNAKGLQRFVYHRTRDFMRRVSSSVTIGRASREDERGDHLLDYWFTLCRKDTPTS